MKEQRQMSIKILDSNKIEVYEVDGEVDAWTLRDLRNWYPRTDYIWIYE